MMRGSHANLLISYTILYTILRAIKLVNSERGCPTDLPGTTLMTSYKGKCYQYVSDEKTWRNARDYCWQHGGSLVKLNDEHTNRFVTDTLSSIGTWSNSAAWIGLNDEEEDDLWKWVTADRNVSMDVAWTNWGDGHPKTGIIYDILFEKNCVHIKRNDMWKWYETYCYDGVERFICEYERATKVTHIVVAVLVAVVTASTCIILIIIIIRRRSQMQRNNATSAQTVHEYEELPLPSTVTSDVNRNSKACATSEQDPQRLPSDDKGNHPSEKMTEKRTGVMASWSHQI